MKKIIAAVIVIPVLVLAALFGYTLYNGPRMTVQPHVRAFQMVAPLPPEGTVTVAAAELLPPAATAANLQNPLPPTADNLQRGGIYYRYYCIFCHGETARATARSARATFPCPPISGPPRYGGTGTGNCCAPCSPASVMSRFWNGWSRRGTAGMSCGTCSRWHGNNESSERLILPLRLKGGNMDVRRILVLCRMTPIAVPPSKRRFGGAKIRRGALCHQAPDRSFEYRVVNAPRLSPPTANKSMRVWSRKQKKNWTG